MGLLSKQGQIDAGLFSLDYLIRKMAGARLVHRLARSGEEAVLSKEGGWSAWKDDRSY
jgi:hypothetical protein